MIAIYRIARWCHLHGIPWLPWVLYSLNRMLFATVVPASAHPGGSLAAVIHRQSRIGANAVVLTDVPAGATAVGVPARIIRPRAGQTGAGGSPAAEGRHAP